MLVIPALLAGAGEIGATKEDGMSLEAAGALYEPLVAAGQLREVPASGIVGHRLAGFVGTVPVGVELTWASGGGTRVVRRTRLLSPLPPGMSMGFSLLPRREGGSGRGDPAARFAERFSVKKGEWGAFVSSGLDRPALSSVLAFLDEHGGVLTIGPELISWQVGGVDVPGQGEALARAFASMAGSLQDALRTGRLAGPAWPSVDAAYIAARAAAPEPVMYVSERALAWVFGTLLLAGLAFLATGLRGPESQRGLFRLLAGFLLLPGIGGIALLAMRLSSSRPALLP